MPPTAPQDRHPGRSRRWVRPAAFLVVVVALLWLITDRLLVGYFPLSWGGPNIGGGLLIGLCYIAIISGLLTLCSAPGLGRWAGRSWAAGIVIVVLLGAYISTRIVDPRDEEAGMVGRTGVTASEDGDPVLLLQVCRGSVDRVRVAGPNRGTEPNENLAEYRSTEPVSGFAELDLLDPDPLWQSDPVLTRDTIAGRSLVIASAVGEKAALSQVSFTPDDLASIAPGVVLEGSGPLAQRRPVQEFRAAACQQDESASTGP